MNSFSHGSQSKQPHFVLVPLMAQGHTIPMTDMAHLLASHGALVTFVTTPLNASRIESIIQHAKDSQLPIQFLSLPFNCAKAGLPEGSENLDTLRTGLQEFTAFMEVSFLNKDPLISYLKEHETPPSCMISDVTLPWTGEVAREFGIPRLFFMPVSAFASLCGDITNLHKMYDNVPDENKPVPVPGFPHPLEVPKNKSILSFSAPGFEKIGAKMIEENSKSVGVIVSSFQELESLYIDFYEKFLEKKVWAIGPMCLYNKSLKQMTSRGNRASIDEERCLKWLDSMQNASVLFVNFGSLARSVPLQLMEIGLGLEASRIPFIWVIKAEDKLPKIEQWLIEEKFEERVKDRGLIIKGWAPQVMILSHRAIGGFMTHCGWNSTIESICNSVPLITWPHFGDQFLNEILIVDVLKIGIRIGVDKSIVWGSEKSDEVMVRKDDVERKVLELMDEEKEGMARRVRARELGDKAKKAMEEGGSSYKNIELLIQLVQERMLKNSSHSQRLRQTSEELARPFATAGAKVLEESSSRGKVSSLPIFDASVILAATNNFAPSNKLGEGGFGSVYKGELERGERIAVKRLANFSTQGLDELKNEVLLIAELQHNNLVCLLGYCIEGEELMLIYEYMENRSLDTILFDKANSFQLDWQKRFEIIKGIARGVLYLHQDSRLRIIHRDLKASNVLLDKNMNPKISDFGLARIFCADDKKWQTNRVVGTYGHMSPEYAMDGIFSVKSRSIRLRALSFN